MDEREPTDNFTTRLTVETTYPDKVIDHRSREFYDREYRRNLQTEPKEEPTKGFPPMKSVTKAPKKKTKKDLELEQANTKDLKNRSIK